MEMLAEDGKEMVVYSKKNKRERTKMKYSEQEVQSALRVRSINALIKTDHIIRVYTCICIYNRTGMLLWATTACER